MRSLLLLLLAGAVVCGKKSEMGRMAQSLRGCCSGNSDVDVAKLLDAANGYCKTLEGFGRFVGPSVANVRGCMEKVTTARAELQAQTRKKLKTIKELLQLERESHQPGGVLADPSAAMGLLWLRRALEYWADVFEQQAEALGRRQRSGRAVLTLAAQCESSYKRLVEPFHGWVSRRAFGIALGLTPDWSDVRERAGLSESDEALRQELTSVVTATRELCGRLRKLHVKLDLEDRRKSI